ncbi:MotE family protein [Maridesulfovibrio bastinii]|uniref:MotE family protein n=1 Tax=Maridesulfovibrio bastinii TaxID=47157 RepID=UPI001FE1C5C5|nr:hypothetical protein [Maridesulfovibrio bastinii]
MKKKISKSRKSTTRWQQLGSNLKISRVLICLIFLALFKLSLIGYLGVDLETSETPVVKKMAVDTNIVREVVTPKAALAAANDQQKPAEKADKPPEGMNANDWKALKAKEDELARKERSLKTLEQSLDKKLAKLADLEKRLKKMIEDANVLKDQKIKHLVGVYSSMKAKSAAAVIETLDMKLAVKILAGMRGKTAGNILNSVDPKKAAILSEALTRLQIPLESN